MSPNGAGISRKEIEVMKRFVRTIFLFATLLLSLAAVATAADRGACTNAVTVGAWAYTLTGTLITPSGSVPFATVGRAIFDVDGNISGTQTGSVGGQISQETFTGIIDEVNPDCTVTFSVDIHNQWGQLLRTVHWAGVFVDSGSEFRGILTSMVLPNGASVPGIVTMNSKKLFPPPGNSR
jgi:hypothetical protein